MANRDIIVIGTSAGGVEALLRLVPMLPADFPASIFITVHFPRTAESILPKILERAGSLSAAHAVNGEPIEHGRIYVAPPDFHLLPTQECVRLVRGPTENGNRPAIDPMFRSAAVWFGPRVIGVILTGNLDDGTAGLLEVRRRGGVGVVQSPDDALYSSMPLSAINHGLANHIVPLDELGALLSRLVREETDVMPPKENDDAQREDAYSAFNLGVIGDPSHHPGDPSPYSCPDCGGVLWGIEDGDLLRFRCRVGHGWSNDALLTRQTDTLDSALWMAFRALEENAALNRQVAKRATGRGNESVAHRFLDVAELAERRAAVIRRILLEPGGTAPDTTSAAVAIGIAGSERKGG